MPGDTLASRSLDELAQQLRQRDARPELAPRSAPWNPNTASVSNTFAEISGMLSDARSEQLGISPPTSAPSRQVAAARPAVGILLYLVFIGLVATVIIVVCFGSGFFLLAREAAPVSGEPEMRGSAVAAALPVFPRAERPATGKTAPPQDGNATRVSVPVPSIGESTASAAKGATPSGGVPPPRMTAGAAGIIAPAQTASAPEPAATSGNPSPIRRGDRGYSWQRYAPPNPGRTK
jgi:hypothetical protein